MFSYSAIREWSSGFYIRRGNRAACAFPRRTESPPLHLQEPYVKMQNI